MGILETGVNSQHNEGGRLWGQTLTLLKKRKVRGIHLIVKCQTTLSRRVPARGSSGSPALWAVVVRIWNTGRIREDRVVLQRQPLGFRPGPSFGNLPTAGCAHRATLPLELLGKPRSSPGSIKTSAQWRSYPPPHSHPVFFIERIDGLFLPYSLLL